MIVGRVDEMAGGKVHGWAFNSDDPSEKLDIRISRGAGIVAAGKADQFRVDLPDAGVGDGYHAFGIDVPPNITSFQGLVIVARSESSGEAVLAIATNDDRRVDDIFHVFSERYDDLLANLKADIDGLRTGDHSESGGALLRPELEDRLTKIEKRMEDFEVFIVRLDEITRKLEQRVGLLRPKGFFAWFRRSKK